MSTTELVTFAYRGRNSTGKVVKGRLDATTQPQMVSKLAGMGISPLEIKEVSNTGLQREIKIPGLSKSVKLKDLAVMSRQMATMLASGLSLLRTLNILSEQTESEPLQKVLAQVHADVERGSSLSAAMMKHRTDFPPLMVNMVKAGEVGGFLDEALESVAQNFEKEVKLHATIKSAMTYPVVVLCMALVGVLAMLIFIVPIFRDMFAGLGGELPVPTQVLVWMSEQMIWAIPVIIIGSIAFAAWWSQNKNTDAVRSKLDPIKLKLPVFGNLFKKLAVARFARNLSNMLGSGVPIMVALEVVGETSGNWVVQEAVRGVTESVRRGRSISKPLEESGVFAPMVTQMVAVGEDSGELETMLDKLAIFYDDEVEQMTSALTSLIEPLLIAFLGIVIGGMIISLYMPVFNVFTLINS